MESYIILVPFLYLIMTDSLEKDLAHLYGVLFQESTLTRASLRIHRKQFTRYDGGQSYTSPLLLNAKIPDGNLRRDVCQHYGDHVVRGSFDHVSGGVAYDPTTNKWNTRPYRQGEDLAVETNIYSKIKVVLLSSTPECCTRLHLATGTSNVLNKSRKNNMSLFLHEVSRCDNPPGTSARYKVSDTDTMVPSIHGWNDTWYGSRSITCPSNINIPRGRVEAVVFARTRSARARQINPWSRLTPLVQRMEENNNSVTLDGAMSCIADEEAFKKQATSGNSPFRMLYKPQFKTHVIVRMYNGDKILDDPTVVDPGNVLKAIACRCDDCAVARQQEMLKQSFHKARNVFHTSVDDVTYFNQCLLPLKSYELQRYPNCLNCSAVPSPILLPIATELESQLLDTSHGSNVRIDCAEVRAKALMEKRFNGLIPSHVNDLIGIMCHYLGTGSMSTKDQMEMFVRKIRPTLRKIRGSRFNFAQSGDFCQRTIRCARIISCRDRMNVSHKYGNADTISMFAPVDRIHLSKESDEYVDERGSQTISLHPRRSCSYAWRYKNEARFQRGVHLLGLPPPDYHT